VRQVVARDGAVHVVDVPSPEVPPNGVLVRAECSLISPGTEAMQIAASAGITDRAQPLGYSLVGRVIARGRDAPAIELGALVACAGGEYAPHAEIAAVPRLMATAVPDGVTAEAAAFTTLGAVAVHALRQGRVALGERVVVFGLGVVGQLLAQVARAAGGRVLGIDPLASRAATARRLGAEMVGNPATVAADVESWSSGLGADCVFLCTAGGDDVLDRAAGVVRDRGRVVIVGTPSIQMRRAALFSKELEVTIARAYGPGRYDLAYEVDGRDYPVGYVRWTQERNRAEFLRLLGAGLVRVEPLITHAYDVGDAPAAYAALRDHPESAMGMLLRYDAAAPGGRNAPRG
jgi:threonine dehydrogenase-like Zn-dependent dehydrogenase